MLLRVQDVTGFPPSISQLVEPADAQTDVEHQQVGEQFSLKVYWFYTHLQTTKIIALFVAHRYTSSQETHF